MWPTVGQALETLKVPFAFAPLPAPDDYQAWSNCALRVDAWRFVRYRQAVIKDLTSAGRPWTDYQGSAGSGKNGEVMNNTPLSTQPKGRRGHSWRGHSWR